MVMRVTRRDRVGLLKPVIMPDGMMVLEGFAAKEGVLEYDRDGELFREYVPGDMLRESAPGLVGRPVTIEHPTVQVTPDNAAVYSVGVVLSAEWDEDAKAVRVRFSANDRELLDALARGTLELSPGYTTDLDDTPGESEYGPYEGVQTSRDYNHLAVVQEARGGPTIRARLDSKGNEVAQGASMNPKFLTLLASLGLGSFASDDEAIAAIGGRLDAMKTEGDSEGMERPDEEGRYDELKTQYDELKAQHDEMAALLEKRDQQLTRALDAIEQMKMKPMMDEYEVTAERGDSTDAIYARIYSKLTGTEYRADSVNKLSPTRLSEIRGAVAFDFERRRSRAPGAGVAFGRRAWSSQPGARARHDARDAALDELEVDLFASTGPTALGMVEREVT